MSVRRLEVRKENYRDSITMLRISNELGKLEGVTQAAAVMGTQLNRKILKDLGFSGPDVESAKADDMIIAIEANEQKFVDRAFGRANELLSTTSSAGVLAKPLPKSLEAAIAQTPDANMVVISVPGQFAKREAQKALTSGLNVFLFSSNVSVEDELELKQLALSRNLLIMGPDCGTSIINNTVLGFGNVLHSGPVGIVSASGTGLQQVSTLLDSAGIGVSHGIGTGGNDVSDKVGGLMMMKGIELLDHDPSTKVIVLISKPPGERTARKVLEVASGCSKPVIVNFLGLKEHSEAGTSCTFALTLDEAAAIAAKKIEEIGTYAKIDSNGKRPLIDENIIVSESLRLSPSQRYVRGLYSGGTLCYEAQVVMRPMLGEIRSNVPLVKAMRIAGDQDFPEGHLCIDMGAEEFVVGRAHPMIDYTLRKLRIMGEAKKRTVAVILLDVLLGYGSNPDPASELVPVIAEAKNLAEQDGRYLSFVASIIGTNGDPQGLERQTRMLRDARVVLEPSNAAAARSAARIALRGMAQEVSVRA
ncbi:MAG TPA: acyl-CoA synthetase FdrA [Nitrososphaerales archaeon]|nr:acyl-CoA synthetase FdrA [Nitrososphaerales archaeon]